MAALVAGKAPAKEYQGVWDGARFLGVWQAGRSAELAAARQELDDARLRGADAEASRAALEAASWLVKAADAEAPEDLGEAVRFAAAAEEALGAAADARRGASRPPGWASRAQAVAFAAKLPLRAALDAHAGGRP